MKQEKQRRIWNKRPKENEGAYIQYLLKTKGVNCSDISQAVGCSRSLPVNILSGRRHSAKVEAEIAMVCGFTSWNEMILSIRHSGLAA